jgi:hypothetical protein
VELCNDRIPLFSKELSQQSLITNPGKTVRLLLVQEEGDSPDPHPLENNPEGCILEVEPLSQQVVEEIKVAWEREVGQNASYKISKDITIIEIFELHDPPPKSWALGLTEA